MDAARKRGIVVNCAAGADAESTAQHTFSLLLELAAGVGHHAHTVRNGRWARSQDFTYRLQPLMELSGQTIGVVGFGRVGQVVARIARGFGMNVLIVDTTPPAAIPEGAHLGELDALLSVSDVVSLHCPHTLQSERLINSATLARMKPSAYLLNTAHGALIDEDAVAASLRERKLSGYAADVLAGEPPSPKNPLLRAPRCILTPHLAWGSRAARERIIQQAAEQLKQFQGSPP
ncbi:MAG: D-2-hydroxyacid dehydrogenase [Kiritimatiellae bacterium]|nr:D-2-hydroxyacid dehydrogenase [Kiritimatiellia bacterium]